ncbi:MAG: serine/threonine phosphatase [Cyanobacteria bacterium J06581_3]
MLTCTNCQFENPADHRFCQRCGEPLTASAVVNTTDTPTLQVRLMPPASLKLVPNTYLGLLDSGVANSDAAEDDAAEDSTADKPDTAEDIEKRYQVLTVLNQGRAQIVDKQPQTHSSLQQKLPQLVQQSTEELTLEDLKTLPQLPEAAYPYLLLSEAAPQLYDAWEQDNTALLIVSNGFTVTPILKAFSTAIDPLQHVYWMYQLTELWTALAPVPQWRSSLLLTDNLGIDTDQSVRILNFVPPVSTDQLLPQISEFKVFLQSLLAQPHRGAVESLHQVRGLILTVSSATTIEQLSTELANIGKALLATPAAVTPKTSTPPPSTSVAVTEATTSALPVPITMPPKPSGSPELPNFPSSNTQPPGGPNADTSAAETSTPETSAPEADSAVDQNPPNLVAPGQDPPTLEVDDSALEKALPEALDLPDVSDGSDATMVLPMKLVSLNDAGRTDVGRQRDHNEDCFLIARESQNYSDNTGQQTQVHGLYILCDGMGGHDGGEVASQLAAQTLSDYFRTHWPVAAPGETASLLPDEATVIEGVKLANQAIFEVNEKEQRAGHERMGTTLVMVLLQGTSAVVAHVGDSRLYQHARRLGLRQVTADHEVGQREILRGVDPEMAYARPDAYQLTQALGPRGSQELEPSVSYMSFTEDTLLLLCSDGLSDSDLVEDYLETHIDPLLRSKKALAVGVNDLIELGNEVNGHDNITAIAIRLEVSPEINKGRLGYSG